MATVSLASLICAGKAGHKWIGGNTALVRSVLHTGRSGNSERIRENWGYKNSRKKQG